MLDKYLRVRINVFAIKGTLPNENPVLTIPAKPAATLFNKKRATSVPGVYTTHFPDMQTGVATQ
jgi:hypothetical protein